VVAAGDVLAPNALERLGQAAVLAPDAVLITCDEDRLDADGSRCDPLIRPGPSPDALAERDVVGRCVRRRPGWPVWPRASTAIAPRWLVPSPAPTAPGRPTSP